MAHRSVAAISIVGLLLVASACQGATTVGSPTTTQAPVNVASSPAAANAAVPANAASADEPANLDVVRTQIKAYYGDPTGTGVVGADSPYARDTRAVAAAGLDWLEHGWSGNAQSRVKAIVLDIDDTSLVTWDYWVHNNWNATAATAMASMTAELAPAVPGMAEMVNQAARDGYAVFWITGRDAAVEAASLGNLTDSDTVGLDAGYPHPTTLNNGEDGLFTKPDIADYPAYLKEACANELSAGTGCTTIHYKSATRAHIESLGYEIVASFGDQLSDLTGGHADRTFKLPNPNYFLP